MKITIKLSERLFEEACELVRRERATLDAIIEEGLRLALAERKRCVEFRLRDAGVKGHGLHPDLAGASWE